MPRVSVVIPTYNQPALLAEAVATVSAQTFADFEVVVVDDGSTDDTPAQLAGMARREPRLRVVRQENRGVGAARNRGIGEAGGRYVALLDHDDLWHPGKLAAQVAFLDSRPQCVACAVPFASSREPGTAWLPRSAAGADGVVRRPLRDEADKHKLYITCSALMFRRAEAAAAGAWFGEDRGAIEDVQFYLRLLAAGGIGIAGEDGTVGGGGGGGGGGTLMTYRIHAGNASGSASYFARGRRLLRTMDRAGAFAGLAGDDRRDYRSLLAAVGRATAYRLLMAGRRRAGFGVYLAELPHQLRHGQWRFAVAYPLRAAGLMRVVRAEER